MMWRHWREPSASRSKGRAANGARASLKDRWLAHVRLGTRRLSRLRASPHEIALGCAAGAFISITPLLGFQTLLAIALAGLLRASIPAAVLGTFVGNPLSWPFIWASTYAMGLQIVGFESVLDPSAFERDMLLVWGALL